MSGQPADFLNGKTEYRLGLFRFFIAQINDIGIVQLHAKKSMFALHSTLDFAYITQFGKNFIHIVLPFNKPFDENLCFVKIAKIPGASQYNHYLRIYAKEDLNEEVRHFLKLAFAGSFRF
ncbi:MAG: hypothetical protein EOO96_24185 [Pedobacter sp.]|nr:MAG: hypothetical protein EOO96_24185 [Pedobacter sp.]